MTLTLNSDRPNAGNLENAQNTPAATICDVMKMNIYNGESFELCNVKGHRIRAPTSNVLEPIKPQKQCKLLL